jgi:hypothetical protein
MNTAGSSTASSNPCNVYILEDNCNAATTGECKWEMMNTGDNTNDNTKPLFGSDFCHPAKITKDTTPAAWTICANKPDVAACGAAVSDGCNWSDGKELIPEGEFCAPMDLTTDVANIYKCVSMDSAVTCPAGCAWKSGTKGPATQPTDPSTPAPLFTANFCHPVTVTKDTTDAVWSTCLNAQEPTDCAKAAGCVYSEGKELIPDHPFCAPMDLTKDIKIIQSCVSADSATTCGTDCQWRQGRTPSTVPTTPNSPAPLFSQDFCHPVVVTKDTAKTVWSNCIDQRTSSTCANAAGCNWSNGKELIPDYDFCAPLELTTNVDTIKTCVTANVATECNDGCQWRKGRAGDNTGNQDGTKQMFPTELCHPAKVSKDTPIADFEKCIASDTAIVCAITNGCTWSEGKELIPDFDFCAPLTLTKDVQVIQ